MMNARNNEERELGINILSTPPAPAYTRSLVRNAHMKIFGGTDDTHEMVNRLFDVSDTEHVYQLDMSSISSIKQDASELYDLYQARSQALKIIVEQAGFVDVDSVSSAMTEQDGHLFIIITGYESVARDDDWCLDHLEDLDMIKNIIWYGRSYGIHIIFAGQEFSNRDFLSQGRVYKANTNHTIHCDIDFEHEKMTIAEAKKALNNMSGHEKVHAYRFTNSESIFFTTK